MALVVGTGNPQGLLSAIKRKIDLREIDTWSYDQDGDFVHTPPQWREGACLKPTVAAGRLSLQVVPRPGVASPLEVYAVYQGRFVEMLLAHFCGSLTDIRVTPNQ